MKPRNQANPPAAAPLPRMDAVRRRRCLKRPERVAGSVERIALVTGANRGIGVEVALALAREPGMRVLMLGRDAASLAAARERVARASGNARVEPVACDLASQRSVREACAALDATLPRL